MDGTDPSARFHTLLSEPWSLFCILSHPCQRTVLPSSPEASWAVSSFRFPYLCLQTFSLSPACPDSLWPQQARDLSPWKEPPLHLAPYLAHLIFSSLSWFLPSCLQTITDLPPRGQESSLELLSFAPEHPERDLNPDPPHPVSAECLCCGLLLVSTQDPCVETLIPSGREFGGGLWE